MRTVSRRTGFVLAAYAFFVNMLGTTLPTPLYPSFQERYSFGELLVTVIFAIYALGVVAGLILFGNLSDQIGRRPPLLLGLAFSAISALLFLLAGSVVPIYAARVISGFSAGIFTGTATAFLVDLAPEARRAFASLVAVVVNLGGLGFGTLLSGLVAEWADHPERLPFALDLVLLVPAVIGVLLCPELVKRKPLKFRLQKLGVPPEVRGVFIRGGTAAFASFAVAGVFSAVAPEFLGQVLDRNSPALTGLLVFVFFGMSLVGQLVVRKLPAAQSLMIGCALLLVGVVLLAVSLETDALAPLLASSVVAGLGQGIVFGAALTAINQRAPVERRGETASSFFVVAYIGLSLPVIGCGIAIQETSLETAGVAFCVAVAVLVVGVMASQLWPPRHRAAT